MKLNFLLSLLMLCTGLSASAQLTQDTKKKVVDTAKKPIKIKANPLKLIKPYNEVINKNFKSQNGLLTVHKHRDSIYFEIPKQLLKRDLLVVNTLAKTSAGTKGAEAFAGTPLDKMMIRFELGRDSAIKIKYVRVEAYANPKDRIAALVESSYGNNTIASFPIKAYAQDSSSYVIDMSKYLVTEGIFNSITEGSFTSSVAMPVPIKDGSVLNIRAFPENLELTISKSLTGKRMQAGSNQVNVETYSSIVLLPEVPMRKRLLDKRVGYFDNNLTYFADNQNKSEKLIFISRWRLEPKDAEFDKWKRGGLVEPKKQIVIYVDPATPKQWVPYMIKGINDWQVAFEKAGFKNAIVGKEWPVDNPDMLIGDARYSVIHYFPSTVANAMGPHIADPRSGEVIHTRIHWHHDIMSRVDSWYKTQTAAVDPAARKVKLDVKLMGELIRGVVAHEVGHTLTLRHNFGASGFTPVEKLRDAKYLKEHGHTNSIMDYARFNYVAQPEDNIPAEYLLPKVGAYDKWAVEWGYGFVGGKDEFEDARLLSKKLTEVLKKNPELAWVDGESNFGDSRALMEDLSDDVITASSYGIKNLKRIMQNLGKWYRDDDTYYTEAHNIRKEIGDQLKRYIGHVTAQIGGFYRNHKTMRESGPVFTNVPREKQIRATKFLNENVFNSLEWLNPKEISALFDDPLYIGDNNPSNRTAVAKLQITALNTVLHDGMLHKIWGNSLRFENNYTVQDHLTLLRSGIWNELEAPTFKADVAKRNLQKTYVGNLLEILKFKNVETAETDVPSIVKEELRKLLADIIKATSSANGVDQLHLQDISDRISRALNPKI
jgi:hypothetical protein